MREPAARQTSKCRLLLGAATAVLVACLGERPVFPDAAVVEARAVRELCDPRAPFVRVEPVPDLAGLAFEASARLTRSEQAVYVSFASTEMGASQRRTEMGWAPRYDAGAPFAKPTRLGFPVGAAEPSISADGLWLYFAMERPGTGSDLFLSRAPFPSNSAEALEALNTPAWEFAPYISADRSTLYFTRQPPPNPSGGGRPDHGDIYAAYRSSGELFGEAFALTDVNTGANERSPVSSGDQLQLYFASDRAGDLDIYVAERTHGAAPFGEPVRLAELSALGPEYPTWISDDACLLYFAAARPEGAIWRATRR